MDNPKIKYNLSDSDKMQLALLLNNKKNPTDAMISAIEAALKCCSEPAPFLYRGLYIREVKIVSGLKVGNRFKLDRYTSFSEKVDVAKNFAKDTNFLIYLEGGSGFNYGKFMRRYLGSIEAINPEEFDIIDGPKMIAIVNTEKEWILSKNAAYKVTSLSEEGGYRIMSCVML